VCACLLLLSVSSGGGGVPFTDVGVSLPGVWSKSMCRGLSIDVCVYVLTTCVKCAWSVCPSPVCLSPSCVCMCPCHVCRAWGRVCTPLMSVCVCVCVCVCVLDWCVCLSAKCVRCVWGLCPSPLLSCVSQVLAISGMLCDTHTKCVLLRDTQTKCVLLCELSP